MRDVEWLLSGEVWIEYRTRIDLLGETFDQKTDAAYRQGILELPLFAELVSELEGWPDKVMKNHKDSGHPIHKLAFLADVGLTVQDARLADTVQTIRSHRSEEGVCQVLSNIPTNFGGSGKDEYSWLLCDAPLLLYAQARMGLAREEELLEATRYLVGLQEDNGWHCKGAKELGRFRGPGRKGDPCPYANLLMLRLLAELGREEFEEAARRGTEALLSLWQHRAERKEYMFGMGTDFKKLKAPLVWLDILHVLDVLSRFEFVHQDARVKEMAGILQEKLDASSRLTAESMYRPWKEWEFANKKEPSRWITFLALRILMRIGVEG